MNVNDVIGFKKSIPTFQADEALPLPLELMGVELEYENVVHNFRTPAPELWTRVNDGSLRNNGQEFIFSEPLYGTGITDALFNMACYLDAHPNIEITDRCSVHVHINVSDMSVEELLRFIVLYLVFERSIIKYHGGTRENNIFCIPFFKAPAALVNITHLFDNLGGSHPESVRQAIEYFDKYYALNIGAAITHGSLEFRHMPGCKDMSKVYDWLCMIQYMKQTAIETTVDYMGIINNMSGNTSFIMYDVFKRLAPEMIYDTLTYDLMQGARLAQSIVKGIAIEDVSILHSKRRINGAVKEKLDRIKKGFNIPKQKKEETEVKKTWDNIPPDTDEWTGGSDSDLDDYIRQIEEAQLNVALRRGE